MKIGKIDINAVTRDIFEAEYETAYNEKMDENGEVDWNDILIYIAITQNEMMLLFRNNTMVYKATPDALHTLFDTTSVKQIEIDEDGYAITTDICKLLSKFNSWHIDVEDM